jgi:S1-C subfamily serine protease
VVSAALKSTVLVEHPLGSGSGFAVAKDLVATNAHVVEGAFPDEIKVKYGKENQPAERISRVVYIDRAKDLCLLQGEMDIKPLQVRGDYELKAGDPVVLMGNPSVRGGILMRNVTNRGKMRSLVHIEGQDLYHIDAEVNPGWSGGPVIDMEGQVVAIVVMKANDNATTEIRANMRKMDQDFREANTSSLEGGITYGIPASSLARVLGDGPLKDRKRQTAAHERYVAQTVVARMNALASLTLLNMQANVPVQVRSEAGTLSQSGESAKTNRFAKLKIDYIQLPPEETCRAITAFLKSRKIRELEDHFRKNLDARLDSVIESENVSSEVKRDLKTLTKKLKDATAFAERPTNSYAGYSVKVNGFSRDLKELVERLEKAVENNEP